MMPSMLRKGLGALLVLAPVLVLSSAPARADGSVVVTVSSAHAVVPESDTLFGTGQDFYPRVIFVGGPSADGPILDGKDDAAWIPPFSLAKTVPVTVRNVDLQVELWDDDDTSADDQFDINPGPGRVIALSFDTCTMAWTAPGFTGPQGPGVVGGFQGDEFPDPGGIRFEVKTGDRRPFTVNDVAIAGVAPVQAVVGPNRVVANKPVALRVDLVSTYGMEITAPVTATLDDHEATGLRSETRTITVPPEGTTVYFFDGMGSEPLYEPGRNAGDPYLEYGVTIDFPESDPPGVDPKFAGCWAANNSVTGRRVPLVLTDDPYVVYQRWDWFGTGPTAPLAWIEEPALESFRSHEETFRNAAWPLFMLNTRNEARPEVTVTNASSIEFPLLSSVLDSLARAGAAASVAGIDRHVLVTRQGWFGENDAVGALIPDNAIGISLGEYGPHAVIAEDGFYGVAVHELGHTYRLSRHSCSTGGLAEGVLELGCRDEYQHAVSDGRVYPGLGLDLAGTVYPSGYIDTSWPSLTCPADLPGVLDVCGASIMDLVPPTAFRNWIDNLATDSLTDDLKRIGDPELINITGWVHIPGGLATGPNPMVFDGGLLFSYHFDGEPDLPKPSYSGSTVGSGPFSGGGPFAVRLNTGQGSFTYRFTPAFRVEGQDLETAWFSFNVPWDPNVHQVELYVPSDIEHLDCEIPPCADGDVLAFVRPRTQKSPVVTTLRAGIDTAPTLAGPQPEPPTIGPGHDVVLAWDEFDEDSPELRSAVVIDKAPGSGGPRGWVPMDIEVSGNTLRIPHDRLQDSAGEYLARVVVSDGVNSTTLTPPDKVFRICNYSNGGVEICDGIDNDCDGLVDEMPLINDEPILSVDAAGLSWTPRCGAAGYDVSIGKMDELGLFGDFRGAGCLATDLAATTLPYAAAPGPGEGWWFLVRVAHETWDTGTELNSRDLSLAGCP